MRDDAGRMWVAVSCEHLREPLARENLRQAGFEVWWPHYSTIVTRRIGTRDCKLPILRGLFAGYLFAGIDDPAETSRIAGPDNCRRIRGCADVVRMACGPAYIRPATLVEWRRKALNDEGLFDPPDWANAHHEASYAIGDRVRLTTGTFAGFIAVVTRVVGSRIDGEIEHEWFGRPPKISVDACQVEAAGARSLSAPWR